MRALVLEDYGTPPRVEVVECGPPGPGEVLVRIVASGVCHSDLHVVTGTLPLPVPIVLGHEASGVVVETGPGTRLQAGDHVVVTWIPACGACFWCRNGQPELCERANAGAVSGTRADGTSPLTWRGRPLFPFSWAGTLAEYAVVPEAAAIPVPAEMPWDAAALLGCAVQTGVGAAWRAPIQPGDTVLVVGLGGVGQNIVQGARLKGAGRIIAVDPVAAKRELARTLGATDVVDPEAADPLAAVLDLTDDRGVDVAFEAVGRADLLALAFNAARRGGTAVAVGVPAPNEDITLNAFAFPSQEKTLTGTWLGGSYPPRDIPRLVALWEAGHLQLEPLVSRRYVLEEAPAAFADLEAGRIVRGVVHCGDPR
ncbi:MAG: Zn-dependent alcohol dehydrogenase [Actinomycetia bacterium]|nr:Zn-dependent alcohol dehydrogenase [Actinomycetes bacterium]